MPNFAALKPVPWGYVAFAALMLFFGAGGTRPASINQGLGTPGPLAYALIVIAAASLVIMRWRPLLAFTITSTAVITYFAVGYAFGPILISEAAAVFMLARRVELRRTLVAVAILYVAALLTGLAHGMFGHATWWGIGDAIIWICAWIAVPTAIGTAIRTRSESQAGVRAEQARRAASEERLQMAQDLHDTLGHGLAVIAMHSGVALHVLDSRPDKARESLEAIRATSKESIDGLRAQLDLLRAGGTDDAPLRPRSGLADAEVLVRRIRSGGVDVAVDIPMLQGIPPDVDEAAYRILQESLTNVLRHAGPARASVRVRHDNGALSLDVIDTGSGPSRSTAATSSRGTGIRGMRARAESVGGTLAAGPGAEGGFAVHATLPCVLEEAS
ncbi:sensor histidine kinase [Antricoccus suffuscus]|nr:sensor histidine kinase [Antricoccus suffuscus]